MGIPSRVKTTSTFPMKTLLVSTFEPSAAHTAGEILAYISVGSYLTGFP
jgi:hypothetical protein